MTTVSTPHTGPDGELTHATSPPLTTGVAINTSSSASSERSGSYRNETATQDTQTSSQHAPTPDTEFETKLRALVSDSHQQGITLRQTGVAIQGLSTYGSDRSTTFALSMDDVFNFPRTIREWYRTMRAPTVALIHDIHALARAGEMVLVLGRPGAGCSTLLKSIAGELDNYKGTSGLIAFDGVPQAEMMQHFRSDVLYNLEYDVHFPHLNVDQTLRFAIACKTPRMRVDDVTRNEYITAQLEMLATVLGLKHTYKTKVGSDTVRGISGGERKRVSLGEALAARASVYCWDNATRGLDASTALEFTQALRSTTTLLKKVTFITIYQAGEQIYDLFDKVTVLYLGHQIYFGPAAEAKAYFEAMGYQCPPRQSTAEFLTAITHPSGRQVRSGFETRVPRTVDEFERYWHASPEYAQLAAEVAEALKQSPEATLAEYHQSFKQERDRFKRQGSRYTLTYLAQFRLLFVRGIQRAYMDRFYTVAQIGSGIIHGFISGSLFYNTPNTVPASFSKGGIIFQGLFFFIFMGVADMATVFSKRRIVEKHQSYSFYHPSAESLASLFTSLPVRIVSITFFTLIYYFLSNLSRTASQFFIYYLFLILCAVTMSTLFITIAEASPSIFEANAMGGILLLSVLMYSSFTIQRVYMHPWFKWISYINPIFYGFEAMMSNEFHNLALNCTELMVPQQSIYAAFDMQYKTCPFAASVPGQPWIDGDALIATNYSYHYSHTWRNLGILFGFWALFVFLQALASEYRRPTAAHGDTLLFKRGGKRGEIPLESDTPRQDDVESKYESTMRSLFGPSVCSVGSLEKQQKHTLTALGSGDTFSWSHVDYVIKIENEERKLLDDIQGFVKPGTLTALMGESGAGKTTLLNVLSRRTDIGVVSGLMLVNGNPLTTAFDRSTGYVQQQDLHVLELTVRESLRFAANLRRPASVSEEEKAAYVETIIEIMDMAAYAEAVVGVIGNGLNVEQRKKLSIAVELVAKPSLLLFLDEPTSGLDSHSAWSIVRLVRSLANAGQAILCTIHQPSATLFEEFDQLLLLRKGGQTVYFGELGLHSLTLLTYFESNGGRPCKAYENPAEYILEVIGAGATSAVAEDWFAKWVASPECASVTLEVQRLEARKIAPPASDNPQTYAMPFLYQVRKVLVRQQTQLWRNPEYLVFKLTLYVVAGLFMGFSFWKVPLSLMGMQNLMLAIFLSCMIAVPVINQMQEMAFRGLELYDVRESKSHTFHWAALLFSQLVAELPYTLIASTLFFLCFYFPLKLRPSSLMAGTFYLVYCIIFLLYYSTYGLMVLTISPDIPTAAVLTTLGFAVVLIFSGVLQPLFLMPTFWRRFLYHVTPYTYLVSSLFTNMMHNRPVECSALELSYLNPPPGFTCKLYLGPFVSASQGYYTNGNGTADCGYCPYKVGDEYLAMLLMSHTKMWRDVGILCGYIVINLVGMFMFYWLFRVRRVHVGLGLRVKALARRHRA